MSIHFLDTSALAKRYVSEAGSDVVRQLLVSSARPIVIISAVTTVELPSLLARHVRESALTAGNALMLRNAFLHHAEKEYLVVPVDQRVLAQARMLLESCAVRALDAIQLASAQVAAGILEEAIIFVCSDRTLLTAARTVGLPTHNPLVSP